MKNTLVVIVGPTGIGKTGIGIMLADHFETEIISADSRQVYREMESGTADPSPDQRRKVKHHFIQTRSIHEYYNASMSEMEVLDLLEKLFHKKDIVLLVGGSGLYVDAVCKGIDDIPTVDPEVRKNMFNQYKSRGFQVLCLMLDGDLLIWASTYGLTFPVLNDHNRSTWSIYGEGYIPLNLVLDI